MNDDVRALFGGQQDEANEGYAAAAAQPVARRQAWEGQGQARVVTSQKQFDDLSNRLSSLELRQEQVETRRQLQRQLSYDKHRRWIYNIHSHTHTQASKIATTVD